MSISVFLIIEARAGEEPMLIFADLVFVNVSALSGEYAPGPMVSTILSALFSPIAADDTVLEAMVWKHSEK